MNPTRRLSTILAIATVAIAGAGIALASVGGSTTDASATPVADGYATDPSEIRSLTRTLSQLDGRSDRLDALLAELRDKSQQVSERGVTTITAGTYDDGASSPTPTPSPTATHDDDEYDDDRYDDGYDEDRYDDDHDDHDEDDRDDDRDDDDEGDDD